MANIGEVEEKSAAANVGDTRSIQYKAAKQTIRCLAKNLVDNEVVWEIVTSEPAVTYSSAVHTIRLRKVTTQLKGQKGQCFMIWTTDFTNDASAGVVQDSTFKKREAFTKIAKMLVAE